MKRRDQIVLISTFMGFSWLAMQGVHELGHVIGAGLTGGTVTGVALHPMTISRTDVYPNPQPLAVVWAGPIIGVLLPLLAYLIASTLRLPGLYLFRFFAGFCLVANGFYIGIGAFMGLADAGDMLRHGSFYWHLILFGVLTVPLGFSFWHGLGPRFGLGRAGGTVSQPAAITSLVLFLLLLGAEIMIGSH